MDDVVTRMARELSDAIAAAVAEDPRVEACRERARAAGFEMKLSLEAIIGFVNRTSPGALAKIGPSAEERPLRRTAQLSRSARTTSASSVRSASPRTKRRRKKSNKNATIDD